MNSSLSNKQQILLMLIPLILFTVVEEWGGLTWALLLSVIYAIGEMSWEYWKYRHISKVTLFSNMMVVGLSFVSYLTQDGMWFKLQPAILEALFAVLLIGSFIIKKPLLISMMQAQGQPINEVMVTFFTGLTWRMGVFFMVQAGLAVYASFHWSTEVWAFLKSIGLFIMMILYMFLEVIIFKMRSFCILSSHPPASSPSSSSSSSSKSPGNNK